MKTKYLKSFKKRFNLRITPNVSLKKRYHERLKLFIENRENELLNDHALVGRLSGLRSFSITGDIRVVYYIENNTAYFLDIGSHNQVY